MKLHAARTLIIKAALDRFFIRTVTPHESFEPVSIAEHKPLQI